MTSATAHEKARASIARKAAWAAAVKAAAALTAALAPNQVCGRIM